MYLKPSDLSPIYKEAIQAEVYFVIMNSPTDYITKNEMKIKFMVPTDEIEEIFYNIYFHNRL